MTVARRRRRNMIASIQKRGIRRRTRRGKDPKSTRKKTKKKSIIKIEREA